MKKFYPVIHSDSSDQTFRNLEICVRAGVDGAFLINHEISCVTLDLIFAQCRDAYPDFFLGINYLGLSAENAMSKMNRDINALWADNAMIKEYLVEQSQAQEVLNIREELSPPWTGQYFGGVAFKYQRPIKDLENACLRAKQYMDVICTSGNATGNPADRSKLVTMKAALGDTPLAVASGVSIDNVLDYKDCVDIFMVATGISKDFLNLDEEKVKALVDKVRIM